MRVHLTISCGGTRPAALVIYERREPQVLLGREAVLIQAECANEIQHAGGLLGFIE